MFYFTDELDFFFWIYPFEVAFKGGRTQDSLKGESVITAYCHDLHFSFSQMSLNRVITRRMNLVCEVIITPPTVAEHRVGTGCRHPNLFVQSLKLLFQNK